MIIICYGIPKSASTYLFNLVLKALELTGRKRVKLTDISEAFLSPDYTHLSRETWKLIAEYNYENSVLVVKTHTPIEKWLADDIRSSENIFCCLSFRDPRDMALSWVDTKERDSQKGLVRGFSNFETVYEVLPELLWHCMGFRGWGKMPKKILADQADIALRPEQVARDVLQIFDIDMDEENFLSSSFDKEELPEFNKGVANRYLDEMSAEEIDFYNSNLGEFIEAFDQYRSDRETMNSFFNDYDIPVHLPRPAIRRIPDDNALNIMHSNASASFIGDGIDFYFEKGGVISFNLLQKSFEAGSKQFLVFVFNSTVAGELSITVTASPRSDSREVWRKTVLLQDASVSTHTMAFSPVSSHPKINLTFRGQPGVELTLQNVFCANRPKPVMDRVDA